MKSTTSLSLCFRFCILWMFDRRAKQAVHCCFMYWQQNYKINPECRFFIIDDSVIERAQLDFQILLHRSKLLYRLWSSGESAAVSFCISCCIYVLLIFYPKLSSLFLVLEVVWEERSGNRSQWQHPCHSFSEAIFGPLHCKNHWQSCRLLQDQLQKILRQGRK